MMKVWKRMLEWQGSSLGVFSGKGDGCVYRVVPCLYARYMFSVLYIKIKSWDGMMQKSGIKTTRLSFAEKRHSRHTNTIFPLSLFPSLRVDIIVSL
jgi:hypothetical protein